MAKFDAEKLGKRLDAINSEQFDKIDKMLEEVLGDTRKNKLVPKRAEQSPISTTRLAS